MPPWCSKEGSDSISLLNINKQTIAKHSGWREAQTRSKGCEAGCWDLSERWWYQAFDQMLLGTDFFSSVFYTRMMRTESQTTYGPPWRGLAMTYRDATKFFPWWQNRCCFRIVEFFLGVFFGGNQEVAPVSDCPIPWPLNVGQQSPSLVWPRRCRPVWACSPSSISCSVLLAGTANALGNQSGSTASTIKRGIL